ncbi:MAG: hypothetical protein ACM3JH_04405 [Acidithiobacillales bacterium]
MDLVFRLSAFGSTCLLCGRLLNPVVVPSAFELSGAYVHTDLRREVTGAEGAALQGGGLAVGDEASDTPHGVGIEGAFVKSAPKGTGAGTPALEVALGVVGGFSHTEADTLDPSGAVVLNASGDARFETFWLRARAPVALRGSAEAAVEIPFNRSRDLVVYGPGNLYESPERRNLYSYTTSAALGYRYRGDGWEGAGALRWAHASTQNNTGLAYANGSGSLWGLEANFIRGLGAFRGSVSGSGLKGSLGFKEGYAPDFVEVTPSREFVRGSAKIEISRPTRALVPFFSAEWVGSRTPYWDFSAPLNTETLFHDLGLAQQFHSNELFLGLGIQLKLRELLTASVAGVYRSGRETVDLLPTSANPGSGSLSVSRTGWGFTVGFTATVR